MEAIRRLIDEMFTDSRLGNDPKVEEWASRLSQAAEAIARAETVAPVVVPVQIRPNTTGPGYVAEFRCGCALHTATGDTPEAARQALQEDLSRRGTA